MSTTIRLADPIRDAPAIADVYRPYVEQTPISFELQPPSAAEMRSRMEKVLARLPWLVAEQSGELVGYAYAGAHGERAAYDWSADISVYVRVDRQRQGVGRALYTALLDVLRALGYVNVYAGITLPNPGSVGLHESIGMRHLGTYHRVGWKSDTWWDVGWYELRLAEPSGEPRPPRSIHELPDLDALIRR
jgi:phosphinothricin acetyltransferase